MTGAAQRPTTLREAVECLSKIDFSSAVLDTKEPVYDLIPWDVLEQAVNNHDALVEALEAVVEASNNAVRAGQAIGRSYTTPPVIQLVEAALKAVK